jgi:hypothetical protein
MAKFGSFFRRLITSFTSDDDYSSSTIPPESRRSVVIIPTVTTTSRSCSTSPRPTFRSITKQTTIQVDNIKNGNSNSNFLSSNTYKPNRRLSAPLIMHASTHQHRKQRSGIVNESIQEALVSPLQRLSLSSTTGNSLNYNNSVNSLGTSVGSVNASPRNEPHSSSLNLSPSNSINLPNSLTNISTLSGRLLEKFFCFIYLTLLFPVN